MKRDGSALVSARTWNRNRSWSRLQTWERSGTRSLTVLLALALLAFMLRPTGAHAAPITSTVNIQFIDVCGVLAGGGKSCAPDLPQQLGSYVQYADAIYAQAGILIAAVPTVNQITINQLAAGSAYGACGKGAASVFCADNSGATIFDTVHQLELTPGDGQSSSPTTLNVFLVNGIINTNNGTPVAGAQVKGWGLIGGNGAVVATGVSGGATASVDTVAHEIGHNLGLIHVADVYDVMDSGTRVVPVSLCQVGVYTCASVPIDPATGKPTAAGTNALDVLTNAQTGNFTNPVSGTPVAQGQLTVLGQSLVINQLPLISTAVPGMAPGLSGGPGCSTSVGNCLTTTVSAGQVGGLLKDVQFRFLDPLDKVLSAHLFHIDKFDDQVVDNIPVTITSATYTVAGVKHIDWIVTPSTALPADEYFAITYSFPGASPAGCGAASGILCDPVYDYTPPFSTRMTSSTAPR